MSGSKHRKAAPPRGSGGHPAQPAVNADPGLPYVVLWHPEADAELRTVEDRAEQVAMRHAAQKLRAEGPRLRFPHQSAVQGKDGAGFRELRPRSGRSVWRPLYRRVKADTFVIFAVAPEAQVDAAGFRRATRAARKRLDTLNLD